MRHIILDSNIILQKPEILSKHIEGVKLIIPDIVLSEIRNVTVHGNYSQDLLKLIYESAKTNFVEVFDARSFIDSKIYSKYYVGKRSTIDIIFVQFYEAYKRDIHPDTILATDDKDLSFILKQFSLISITSKELSKIFFSALSSDKQLSEEIEKLKNRFQKRIIISFIAGILSTVIVILAYFYVEVIVGTLNIWGTILIIPILGLIFFYFRTKWRLFYGITEFLVGIFTALLIFLPSFDFNSLSTKPFYFLQIIGGLYIMVRGLDNVGKGLRATKLEIYWRKIFGDNSV
jgi:hypothetical protein